MAKTTLTHKLRNPKDYNSWMDIWTATVSNDDSNNYTITPSKKWKFSIENLTDLHIPSYRLRSELDNNNNIKVNLIEKTDDENQQQHENILDEFNFSAGSNISLTSDNNNYTINSIWQQNTETENGYIPGPLSIFKSDEEDSSSSGDSSSETKTYPNVVWGWPGEGDPRWLSLSELNEDAKWKVSTTGIQFNDNTLIVPAQAVVSVQVRENNGQVESVDAIIHPIDVTNGILSLSPNKQIVTSVTGLG